MISLYWCARSIKSTAWMTAQLPPWDPDSKVTLGSGFQSICFQWIDHSGSISFGSVIWDQLRIFATKTNMPTMATCSPMLTLIWTRSWDQDLSIQHVPHYLGCTLSQLRALYKITLHNTGNFPVVSTLKLVLGSQVAEVTWESGLVRSLKHHH